MKSKTKSTLTNKEIERLVNINFGCDVQSISELKGGMMNSAYEIKLITDKMPYDSLILKVSYSPGTEVLTYEKDIMRTEVQVYELLADKKLPIPTVLKYDFSHKIINNDYFFMTAVSGTTWEKTKKEISVDDKKRLMNELGRYQAIIHSISNDTFGYIKDGKSQFSSWSEAFSSMMRDILNDGRRKGVRLPYDEITNVVDKRKKLLDEIKKPQLVDFDLWAGNVFLDSKDGKWYISGIIDFERAFFGDPFADFIASINIYSDINVEKQFIEGYLSENQNFQIIPKDNERMQLYRLYMAVILAVETYRYNFIYGAMVKAYSKQNINKILKELNSGNK